MWTTLELWASEWSVGTWELEKRKNEQKELHREPRKTITPIRHDFMSTLGVEREGNSSCTWGTPRWSIIILLVHVHAT